MSEYVVDLHADIRELASWLERAVQLHDVTDAYLLTCAIAQVMDDWAEGTDSIPRRLTALLGDGGVARRGVRLAADIGLARRAVLDGRGVRRVRAEVDRLASRLADGVVADAEAGEHVMAEAEASVARLARGLADLPSAVLGGLARPPSCFRSFDQHPRDCVELARRFAQQHPDRERAGLLVLGVRTSGAYLAPLIAASLRVHGFGRAAAAAARPGGPLPAAALAAARSGAARGAVLVVDDPPSTGGSIAKIVRSVRRHGFEASEVLAVYASFGGEPARALPEDLPRVVLPAAEWHIRRLLGGARVEELVRRALAGQDVVDVVSDEPGLPDRSGHLGVRVTAWVRDESGVRRHELRAEGAGTGYLGRHALEVAERMRGLVPAVYALSDGVLLRASGEALPASAVPADVMVGYVAARRERLRVACDRGSELRGRQPVWEIASRIFASGFGRLGPVVRPVLIDPLLRSVLASANPCLTDGTTAFAAWEKSAIGTVRKADYEDGFFSHLDLACYDAAYDLAGAAVALPETRPALPAAYESAVGEPIPPSRWCVYQCVQAWNLRRVGTADGDPRRAQARALQGLFGQLFLGDLDDEPTGPWCVLDVDGVLELDFGGVPATTVAAMTALRALRAHGFRVLLATGRSLPEVRDRCTAYRLAGGVAEYGAVAYGAGDGSVFDLVDGEVWGRRRDALVGELARSSAVRIDPKYRWCVRAAGLEAAAEAAHPWFTAVRGDAQTDFVPRGVEKAAGVRVLLASLGEKDAPVALAVGDTAMDIGILRMAERGYAPRHAGRALRSRGVAQTTAPYQAGLAQAVGHLIGHRPGGCDRCAAPRLRPADRLVTSLVSVGERGRRGIVPSMLKLAVLRARLGRKAGPWT